MRRASLILAVTLLALTGACATAPPAGERELRIRGSDTMLLLNRRLAEGYMRGHPGEVVLVEGGGSGVGVEALVDGVVDLAAASRPLLAEEIAAIYDRFATLGVRVLVAQDALSVFVHDDNPVRSLSLDQLRGLFDGSIDSWAAVGGDEERVLPVVRPPSSGSHRFFRDHVLMGRPYASGAVAVASTRDVLAAVADHRGAIGYGGLAYRMPGVAAIAVDGVAPSEAAVRANRYPLARYLAFYAAEPPEGLAGRFVDWCLGPEGQAIVAEAGYVPLWRR
jgi:phosphate transport system substrate-binding protein